MKLTNVARLGRNVHVLFATQLSKANRHPSVKLSVQPCFIFTLKTDWKEHFTAEPKLQEVSMESLEFRVCFRAMMHHVWFRPFVSVRLVVKCKSQKLAPEKSSRNVALAFGRHPANWRPPELMTAVRCWNKNRKHLLHSVVGTAPTIRAKHQIDRTTRESYVPVGWVAETNWPLL